MTQAWDDVSAAAPTALTEARLLAHHAAQWATRAACANLMPMPGDTQTNLGWDRLHGALVSHDLPLKTEEALRVGLVIESLTLIVLRGDSIAEQLPLSGKTNAQAGAWLDRIAMAAGLALPGGATMPYAIPAHPVGNGAAYAPCAELKTLAAWFADADDVLGEIHAGLPEGTASPVRCWPHHFDIATLWTLGAGDAATAASVGIGLCPGDSAFPQPYFYVSPWPYPARDKLPSLPAPGHWHTQDFTAEILTGEDVLSLADRRAGTKQFLDAAIAVARGALSR
jgi:hypothetical protein